MSRSNLLILVGLLTMLVAFMGIRLSWLRFILPVLGLVTVVMGFLIRTERIAAAKRETSPQPASPSPNDLSPIS